MFQPRVIDGYIIAAQLSIQFGAGRRRVANSISPSGRCRQRSAISK
jgi:hypothetical protein